MVCELLTLCDHTTRNSQCILFHNFFVIAAVSTIALESKSNSLLMKMVYLEKESETSSSIFMAGFKAHFKHFLRVYSSGVHGKVMCGQILRHCSCPNVNQTKASEKVSKDMMSSGYSTMSLEESAFSSQSQGFGRLRNSKPYHQV